jgi:4-amino-4-deoxy-L-arabinose transferase-like glycosyltransferase
MTTSMLPARPAGASIEEERPVSAGELAVLAAILLAAFIARYWAFATTGMTHFDEGVYAISASGLLEAPYHLFPRQINFSPPFYFTSVGLATRLFGGEPDRVAVFLNIVFGTITVLAVWWVGRAWFSARAGVMAAMLLAFDQFHILLSRVVLTDAAFAMWFIIALGALTRAVDRRDFRIAVVAGIAVGLAWNTKYHGWFALAITGVALVPTLWSERANGAWRRPLAVWATAAVVAGVIYLPWAAFIRVYSGGGGYGSILRYYATMLSIDWLGNVAAQARQQLYLEGMLTRIAPLLALGAGLLVRPARGALPVALAALLLGAGALLIGLAGVAALLAIAALPVLLRDFDRFHARVLLCWVGLWVVAAPVYHPYARLILPFTIATFLLSGLMLDRVMGVAERRGHRAGAAIAFAGAAVVAAVAAVLRDESGDPWRPSRDLAYVADSIAQRVNPDATIHVLGEPPLAHYLRRSGRAAPPRVDLDVFDTATTTSYLATGRYTDRAPLLRNRVAELSDRLTRVAAFTFDPNDLRLLDDLSTADARRYRAARDTTFDITLYRVAPAARARPDAPAADARQ